MTQDPKPGSPFGPAKAWDLSGWTFGAFVKGLDRKHHGFFLDPAGVERRMRAYAELREGAPLPKIFIACMLPPRVEWLFEHWELDWRSRSGRAGWVGPGGRRPGSEPEAAPWNLGDRGVPPAQRFAFISASFTSRLGAVNAEMGSRDPNDFAREDAAIGWREELAHMGVATVPWSGRSLVELGNGFRFDDIMASAREEAQGAFLGLSLSRDLPAGPASARRPL